MIHLIGNKHSGYGPDGRRLYFKGGGGSSAKYASLEDLYAEQAASARLLREQAEANLPGAVQSYVGQVQAIQDPGYADRQAGMAGADMASANAMERAATERSLASMGVNPNDARFAGSMRQTELNNAARLAAGQNIARNDAQKYQLAVAQDAVGTFTGQSNNAASQLGNAASGLGSIYASQANQQMAQDQAQSNAAGNAVAGGMMALSMFKDGGRVKGYGLRMLARDKAGERRTPVVERHMLGGQAGSQQNQGFFQMQQIAPPPVAQAPQQGSPVGAALGTANQVMTAKKLYDKATIGVEAQQAAAPVAEAAITPVGEIAGAAAADSAATAGTAAAADTAATAATAAAAEGAAAAGGAAAGGAAAGGALAAAGAALPWVGAAYAVGSLLELWADGGKVGTQRDAATDEQRFVQAFNAGEAKDIRAGGQVPGEWQGNTDAVPALLTEEEHVLNAEASKLVGHDALERLNKKGLAMRKQGKTPETIKKVGLGALA